MHALIQGVILGLLTGGVYALMASGQTLIFGIMKVVNLAQGAMVILGAFLSYQLFTSLGIDPFLAIPVTTVVMFGLGVAIEVAFLRPLRREDRSELSLLITFAVALLIEGVMSVTWQTNHRSINTSYANASWTVLGYQITVVRFFACVLSVVILGLLFLLLNRTRFGRAVRAILEAAVDEDASDDVVAGATHVGHHVIQHVAATVAPDVVVRIDDWQIRLENRLRQRLSEPVVAWREDAAELGLERRASHGTLFSVAWLKFCERFLSANGTSPGVGRFFKEPALARKLSVGQADKSSPSLVTGLDLVSIGPVQAGGIAFLLA
jgi:hypothetical protein